VPRAKPATRAPPKINDWKERMGMDTDRSVGIQAIGRRPGSQPPNRQRRNGVASIYPDFPGGKTATCGRGRGGAGMPGGNRWTFCGDSFCRASVRLKLRLISGERMSVRFSAVLNKKPPANALRLMETTTPGNPGTASGRTSRRRPPLSGLSIGAEAACKASAGAEAVPNREVVSLTRLV
jgi:hypothetical protein